MGSKTVVADAPHAVCIPFPAQSHIKAMLKFAKILHRKGFHITFVNTEFNHQRLLKVGGPNSLDGLPGFRFETIPDGLPPSDSNASTDLDALCVSILKNFLAPFSALLAKLNTPTSGNLPVTCIVSDTCMPFSVTAAQELRIPVVMYFAISACSSMGCIQLTSLRDKGFTPLKDASYFTNGYLDTVIDWIPGMRDIRLRELPIFPTTDPNNILFNFTIEAAEGASKASGVVIQTFDALEREVLDALSPMFPHLYAIGPFQLLLNQSLEDPLKSIGYGLWKEDTECLHWLNSKAPNSVVYVNFGSLVVMTAEQLVEFGYGLANSKHPFLWIIRPDLVEGESAVLPSEFLEETKDRGLIASWCPQEEVLNHPAVGGFLTHCGWNSILESVCAGVPMLCWPLLGDQQTNCKYACKDALAIARQASRTPIAARSFSASVARRDAKADPSPGQEMPGKIVPFDQIKGESDLLPPGAPTGAIATDLDQATGLERLEILGKMQGVDIFDMRPLDASRKGTMEDPVIVKSFGDEQYVGCTGVPADTHGQVWLVISRNRPYERCTECGNVLKMEYVGPAEDPHGHHDHGHGHGDHAHADASTNYGGEPKSIIDYLKPEYRWGQA